MAEKTELRAMTVGQLYEFLQTAVAADARIKDKKLAIVIERSTGTFGGSPKMPIIGAIFGFDWDSGYLLFAPQGPLTKVTENK